MKYVLAQFDAGIWPHQKLLDLQYRDFLPSVTNKTIEKCICNNGRVVLDQQTDDETQENQLLEVSQASHIFLLSACKGLTVSCTTIQESD